MQILHLFSKYDMEHMDTVSTLDEAMELLPVTVHRLTQRYTECTADILLHSWGLPEPGGMPAILLINAVESKFIYPQFYDTQEQLIAEILDFFGVLWGEK